MSASFKDTHQKMPKEPVVSTLQLACDGCGTITPAPSAMAGRPIQCLNCKDYMIVPKSRLAAGVVIGDFVLRQILGRGGMGMVFQAYQQSLDRTCALKILHEQTVVADEHGIDDLLKEARLAAKLNHPNIVQCYAVGEEEGMYYYAMEYVEGKTLRRMLNEKWKLPPGMAISIVGQVAEALEYAWKKSRLVHRDIKPENIMLTDDGIAKLADLGLARPAHETDERGKELMIGSPHFMCPEQVLGVPMDYRGDMYSLGAVLYTCVTGKFPFVGQTPEDTAGKHLDEEPAPPTDHTPELPHKLCQVIETMMAKKPQDRYADFEALQSNLQKAMAECPDTSSGGTTSINFYRRQEENRPKLRVLRKVDKRGEDGDDGGDSFEEIQLPKRLTVEELDTRPHPVDPDAEESSGGRPMTAEATLPAPRERSRGKGGLVLFLLAILLAGGAVGWLYRDQLLLMVNPSREAGPPPGARRAEVPVGASVPVPTAWARTLPPLPPELMPAEAADPPLQGRLRLAAEPGTENYAKALIEAFQAVHSGVEVELVDDDDQAASLRWLEADADPGLPPLVVGLRAYAVVAGPASPLTATGLTRPQVGDLFAEPEAIEDEARVHPYGPPLQTPVAAGFAELTMGGRHFAEAYTPAANAESLATLLAEDPQGVAFVEPADIPAGAVVLTVDGKQLAASGMERWPLARRLVLELPQQGDTPQLRAFVAVAGAQQAQRALTEAGLYPVGPAYSFNARVANGLYPNMVESLRLWKQLATVDPQLGVGEVRAKVADRVKAAEHAFRQGEYAEAAKLYDELIPRLASLRALMELRDQSLAAAIAARHAAQLAREHEVAEVEPASFGAGFSQLNEAERYLQNGDLISAQRSFQKAREHYLSALSKAGAQRFETALEPLDREVLQAHGGAQWAVVAASLERARLQEGGGKLEEAAASWRQAREALPAAADAAVNTCWRSATQFAEDNQPVLALSFAEKVLALDEGHAEARQLWRTLRSNLGFKAGQLHTNSIGMRLAYAPPGRFIMGSPQDEPLRDADERQRQVVITRGFFVAINEVTQGQWDRVMGKDYVPVQGVHPNDEERGFVAPNLPKHTVTWDEARLFCERLSKLEGKRYRLPTEAEWEYACRAGTTTAYHLGSRLQVGQANVYFPAAAGAAAPKAVGSHEPANAWGLNDMHGNVWEWCSDWAAPYPEEATSVDPRGPDQPTERLDVAKRILRGASWYDEAGMARAANRWEQMPIVGTNYIGFRVVLEAAEVER